MDSGSNNDVVDCALETREERIRKYAFAWYQFRLHYGHPGNAAGDWARAEHIVQAEDIAREKEQNDN